MLDHEDSSADTLDVLSSTMGIQSLSSTKNTPEQGVLDLGGEIEVIQAKINSTEIALRKIQQTHEQRRRTAEQELGELTLELQNAKETAQNALRQQVSEQEGELERLQKQFDDELAALDAGIERNIREDAEWKEKRKEVYDLGEQSKLYDLQSHIEHERSKAEENENIQAINQAQKRMQLEFDIESAKKKVQMLEAEISELTAVRREKNVEFQLKSSDLTNKMEAKERDHNIAVSKLQKEIAQRDVTFAHHIDSAKAMLEKEKQQSSHETETYTTRLQSLQQLYHTTSKRGSQQVDNLNKEIERLKKSVDEAKAGEGGITDKFKEDASKVQNVQSEIAKLKLEYQNLQSEIARTTQENARAKRELASVSKSHKFTATSLSTRGSARRSVFNY